MLAPKRLLTALALTLIGSTVAQAADEVVVYSSRIDELIKPVFDAYTAKTGVQVKFITDKEACLLYTSPSPRDRTRSRMPSSA